MTARPSSVIQGRRSSEAIKAILNLHFPEAKTAIDPTYGKGVFWRGIDGIAVLGGDVDACKAPHWVGDCRHLPFKGSSFDIGVLDLPFMEDAHAHTGTNLWDDFSGLRGASFVDLVYVAAAELRRVCSQGFIIKCKDQVHGWKYNPTHSDIIADIGTPYDVLVFVPQVVLVNDPKWKTIRHFRRQESYFLIYKI